VKYSFDSKAGIILVKTKLHGPAGDGIVNLALDTGATWTLVSWEISVQRGYDPASVRERTPGNDGERGRILSEDKSETFAGYGKVGFERGCFVSHFAAD